MASLQPIRDWFKYERLQSYRALSHLPRDVALKRLSAVEKSVHRERAPQRRFVAVAAVVLLTGSLMCALLLDARNPLLHLPIFATNALSIFWGFSDGRIVKRRLRALVEYERESRLSASCIECGYDMRGSPSSTCPECGFDSLAKPDGYE